VQWRDESFQPRCGDLRDRSAPGPDYDGLRRNREPVARILGNWFELPASDRPPAAPLPANFVLRHWPAGWRSLVTDNRWPPHARPPDTPTPPADARLESDSGPPAESGDKIVPLRPALPRDAVPGQVPAARQSSSATDLREYLDLHLQ